MYNTHMDKKHSKLNKTTISVTPQKHRVHFCLFAENSPFRARTVENKKRFFRHEKHRNQGNYHEQV